MQAVPACCKIKDATLYDLIQASRSQQVKWMEAQWKLKCGTRCRLSGAGTVAAQPESESGDPLKHDRIGDCVSRRTSHCVTSLHELHYKLVRYEPCCLDTIKVFRLVVK